MVGIEWLNNQIRQFLRALLYKSKKQKKQHILRTLAREPVRFQIEYYYAHFKRQKEAIEELVEIIRSDSEFALMYPEYFLMNLDLEYYQLSEIQKDVRKVVEYPRMIEYRDKKFLRIHIGGKWLSYKEFVPLVSNGKFPLFTIRRVPSKVFRFKKPVFVPWAYKVEEILEISRSRRKVFL